MGFRSSRRAFLSLGLPLCLAGCSSDDGGSSTPALEKVELLSWWVAASEIDALGALVAVHRKHFPNDRIHNTTVETGVLAQQQLYDELEAGDPPDVYQENAYDLAAILHDEPGSLASLDEFFAQHGLLDAVVPEVLEAVTVDGVIRAMPVNIHRENSLLYNVKIFDELGLTPPTTLEELRTVCEALVAEGITPLATAYEGWIQRILFNGLAAASMGIDAYNGYFSGKTALDEAAMRKAIALLDEVLTSYVNDSANDPGLGWTDVAGLVNQGKAAMFIHGDWAKGYYIELGLIPGFDFGVVGMPGASDLFLYGVDVFAMIEGGPNPSGTRRFLETVCSKEGQTAFNNLKGSTPVRLDVNPEDLDVTGQGTLEDLRNAKIRMLTRTKAVWDAAFADFAATRDADALIAVFVANPPNQ